MVLNISPCSRRSFCTNLPPDAAGSTMSGINAKVRKSGGHMNVHATPSAAKSPPALPSAKPEAIGLSPARLQKMSEAFQREIDKGTTPGVVTLVARRGQIGWFEAQGK